MSGSAARIVDLAEALGVVLEHAAAVPALDRESVALLSSANRILAQSISADRDQPPFHRATRDGFAVRADEWSSGAQLRITGQVRAGEAWRGGLMAHGAAMARGDAIEIMTGAAVPAGADAVAMLEHAEQASGTVWAAAGRTLRAGENLVARGSEARAGDVLLRAGTTMGSAETALAATCGFAELSVYRRARVSILATGDELVEVQETPAPRQIRNSNSYALAMMTAAAGGEPSILPIARDTRDDLRASIDEGRTADLLLLSGGVSAGKYDLVEDALAEFSAEFFFTGVRMQPGRPVVFGRIPRGNGAWTYFFGLPGNPVSTEVTFRCFVEPVLRAIGGASAETLAPKFAQATLAEDVRGKPGLTRLLPAQLTRSLTQPHVLLVAWQGSGDLAANARANCYAVLPDGRDLRAGDVITILLR